MSETDKLASVRTQRQTGFQLSERTKRVQMAKSSTAATPSPTQRRGELEAPPKLIICKLHATCSGGIIVPIFTREESLLVLIHERRELESRHMPVLAELISRGWVAATQTGEGGFTDVALTLKGQEVVSEVISRD